MKSNKPFPPYGKQLWEMLSEGKQPKNDIFLFSGMNAWEIGKTFSNHQVILILPYGYQPDEFRWPVQNCSVLAFHTDSNPDIRYIRKLAYTLLCSSATIVRVAFDHSMAIYRRT